MGILVSSFLLASVAGAQPRALVQASGAGEAYYRTSTSTLHLPSGSVALDSYEVTEALALRVGADVESWALLAFRMPGSTASATVTHSQQPIPEMVVLFGAQRGSEVGEAILPPSRSQRSSPILLPARDARAFAGVAWMQGDSPRREEIWWSSWDGRFSSPRRLVGAGAGSQLALAGTALDGGRSLLVWSAFDGEDTEILFLVQRADGSWTAPRRVAALDNRVPDVTPTVHATADGTAIVAWSTFDEEALQYRVVAAAFDGRRFGPVRAVGPAGSMKPRFVDRGSAWSSAVGGAELLFAEAAPRAWTVARIGFESATTASNAAPRWVPVVHASARLESAERQTPLVRVTRDDVTFSWDRPSSLPAAPSSEAGEVERVSHRPELETVRVELSTPPTPSSRPRGSQP